MIVRLRSVRYEARVCALLYFFILQRNTSSLLIEYVALHCVNVLSCVSLRFESHVFLRFHDIAYTY